MPVSLQWQTDRLVVLIGEESDRCKLFMFDFTNDGCQDEVLLCATGSNNAKTPDTTLLNQIWFDGIWPCTSWQCGMNKVTASAGTEVVKLNWKMIRSVEWLFMFQQFQHFAGNLTCRVKHNLSCALEWDTYTNQQSFYLVTNNDLLQKISSIINFSNTNQN